MRRFTARGSHKSLYRLTDGEYQSVNSPMRLPKFSSR
jgi:hypothetical protein